MNRYLKTPEEVSKLTEEGLTYFKTIGDLAILGNDKGNYKTHVKNVRKLRPNNYGSGRTLGEISGGSLGLDLFVPKRPGDPERLQGSESSYNKGYSN